jgi:sugar phosphate isomerase/epimerase
LSLEEVLAFAAEAGYSSVEVMCWPPGKAERRYAGVTHLDVENFDPPTIRDLTARYNVGISGLGYYPNPLSSDRAEAELAVAHLHRLIDVAAELHIGLVNSFVGRDPSLSIEANWPRFLETWQPIIAHAEHEGVRVGIENCPMLFTLDEWPGGKNLATSPEIWRKLFEMCDAVAGGVVGLNFDPSHLVWQFIDCPRAVREFGKRLVHVHAKDERIDQSRLYEVGIMGMGWHVPKLPGLGDVRWGEFFAALTDAGYNGPVCVEVEDRAYEGSLADRRRALRQSKKFLEQYMG